MPQVTQSAHSRGIRVQTTSPAWPGPLMGAIAAVLFSVGMAQAANQVCDAGTLDSSFGAGGSVALNEPFAAVASVEGIILDRKDRTIVPVGSSVDSSGNFTISLVRTTHKGLPDKTFGVGGRVVVATATPNVATTLAEDASGRILFLVVSNPIGGLFPNSGANATLTVYRLLENGQPDMTFGTAGAAVIGGLNSVWPIISMASDSDSRVLIAVGAANYAIEPSTGRIVTTLLRVTASGTPDATFGNGGIAQAALETTGPDRATDVLVQSDGRILVLGRTHTGALGSFSQGKDLDFYAMRFLADGTLDASYGTNGSTIIDFGLNQANGRKGGLQPDGKLVIAGNVNRTGLTDPFPSYVGWVRLDTDGSRDATFGTNGQASIPVGLYGGVVIDMAIQDDGKIIGGLGGIYDANGNFISAGVMRISAGGTLDTTYAADGVADIVPVGYVGAGGSYVRVDSKNRAVLSFAAYTSDSAVNFLARFEPGKCK